MNKLEEINQLLPDNINKEITPQDVRDAFAKTFQEIVEKENTLKAKLSETISLQITETNLVRVHAGKEMMRRFVKWNKMTGFGQIHLDFWVNSDVSDKVLFNLPDQAPVSGDLIEVMADITTNSSIWLEPNQRAIKGTLKAGKRYIIDLWGFFKV